MKGWVIYSHGAEDQVRDALKITKLSDEVLRPVNADEAVFMVDQSLQPRFWLDGIPTDPPDFVLTGVGLSPYAFSLLTQLELVGSICINPASVIRLTNDKLATSQVLANAGVPIVRTIPLNDKVTAQMLDEQFGFPLVVKPNGDYGGHGVELIQTREEFASYTRAHAESIAVGGKLLAQPFIATSKGKDLRVVMIDQKPVFAYMRKASSPDEFRSNISIGGHIEPFDLTDELRDLSVKIVKTMNLILAGIDYLFTDNGVVVTEVNAVPGIAVPAIKGRPDPQIAIKKLLDYVSAQMALHS